MQKVICEVYDSLCNLKLAIDGTIVMSPNLRTSLDAMYDARIPEKWMKVSIECILKLTWLSGRSSKQYMYLNCGLASLAEYLDCMDFHKSMKIN